MLRSSSNRSSGRSSAKERSLSPVPTATSSSSERSFGDYEGSDQESSPRTPEPLKAGETSPSLTCVQRKLSAAVVTNPDVEHKLLEGRPKIVIPSCDEKAQSDYRLADFALNPPPLRLNAWAEADATGFNVRSRKYMADSKKHQSLPSVFKLLTVDLVKVNQPIFTGLCSHPAERIQTALRKEKETGVRELPEFIFAVNLCVPGKTMHHWVAYFGLDDVSVLQDRNTPLGRITEPFFFGDSDEYRDKTFKLIPRIVQGNFVVKKAVGSKPSILGSKLKQYYVQDPNERYFELIVDIGSCSVAQKIVKLALGYSKSLVVDMMFLLEGVDERTLPERILGGTRVSYLDFKQKDGQRLCQPPQM